MSLFIPYTEPAPTDKDCAQVKEVTPVAPTEKLHSPTAKENITESELREILGPDNYGWLEQVRRGKLPPWAQDLKEDEAPIKERHWRSSQDNESPDEKQARRFAQIRDLMARDASTLSPRERRAILAFVGRKNPNHIPDICDTKLWWDKHPVDRDSAEAQLRALRRAGTKFLETQQLEKVLVPLRERFDANIYSFNKAAIDLTGKGSSRSVLFKHWSAWTAERKAKSDADDKQRDAERRDAERVANSKRGRLKAAREQARVSKFLERLKSLSADADVENA